MHVNVRGHGQRAARSGAAFGDIHGCGGQHRRVVGPVNGHGQGIGGRSAVTVRHREDEAVGQAFAQTQSLHFGQSIIQAIGIVARSIQDKRAILAHRACLGNKIHHIMQIRINRDRQDTADTGRILGNGGCGRAHGGRVVAAVDTHGYGSRGRTAVIIGHCDRKGIGQTFARAQPFYRGQRGIQHIGVVAVRIHTERAVTARRIGLGRKADHVVHIRIRGHGQRAAGSRAAFGDIHGCGGQRRRVVGPVDSHGQGIGGRSAVIVRHREGKGIGQAFTQTQSLHCGQGIVQGIGIVAVGVHLERTVTAGGIGLGRECHCIMNIRVHRRGQRAADRWRVLGYDCRGCGHGGRVVAAVDAHGHNRGGRSAVVVRHCNHKGVGQAFAQTQPLHRGQRGIQHIGIVAVRIHTERAVTARCIGLGRKADHVVHIRIRGHGQRAAGSGAVFSDIHGCGGQHRRVVGPVDGHGQCAGGRPAVNVGRRERKGVGKAFAHAQALHRGQRIVQGIGIVARGIQCERAIEPDRTCLRHKTRDIMKIRVHGSGQRAADPDCILGDVGRCRRHCGRVIAAVDAHGQSAGGRAAVAVGCRERKDVGEAFANAQALHRWQGIIQGIGVIARGIQRECAIEPGRICLRNKTRNIMKIRVQGSGQRAADPGRILNNGGGGSSHDGRVIAAVDAHGYDRGR